MVVWCVCLGEEDEEEGARAGRQEGRACGGEGAHPFCLHVWESAVAPGGGGSLLRPSAPVNNARGECFMARAGL